jgi:Glyoxalase/Bleomycin resistance protein/Dioxygenase superfamily
MINAAHVLLYSSHPEADRAFFRDALNFPAVDAGGGWLIFALPPAEVAIHPTEPGRDRTQPHGGRRLLGAVLYLMCDDLRATMASLKAKNVACSEIEEEQWGIHTSVILPSGSEMVYISPSIRWRIKLNSARRIHAEGVLDVDRSLHHPVVVQVLKGIASIAFLLASLQGRPCFHDRPC